MAKKKNKNKSPSLNDKNNNKKASISKVLGDKSKANYSVETEFLKEEFANEYAEREMLIEKGTDLQSTLKAVDAPPVDLSADVNVDLLLELNENEANTELPAIENFVLDDGSTFSLQFESEATEAEKENDDINEESTHDTIESEATVEINKEIVGFDFGEENVGEIHSDNADISEVDAITVNLTDDLKEAEEEIFTAKNAEVVQVGLSLSDNAENFAEKKTKSKKSKKAKKVETQEENDTTIVDAVAKELENEARQTLIQKIMQRDSTTGEEEAITEQEESSNNATDEVIVEAHNEVINTPNESTDSFSTENQEFKKGIDSKSSDTLLSENDEEEEYRRALAIRDKRLKKAKSVFDFLELFIFTLLAVLLVTTFFVRHSIVDGDSMLGTLEDGQSLLVSDFMYKPECGDIIVVEDYTTILKKPIVKRIIAVGGQTVKVARHGIYVDGVLLDEPYVFTDGVVYEYNVTPSSALLENETLVTGYNYYELVVPEGELFVMGDHRNMSMDSRDIGTVREDGIIGKVLVRIAPFDDFKIFN